MHGEVDGGEYWVYVPPDSSPDRPLPLLLALHGDEGDPWRNIAYHFPDLWESRRDFILVMPRCPWGSWWRSSDQSARFVDALLEHLFERYNVDRERVYAWGFSGGGCFLGGYAEERQDVIAAVSHNVGGCYGGDEAGPEPGCLIPARLVTGSGDHQRSNVLGLADGYERHGHEVDLHDIPGLRHTMTDEMLGPTLDWLMARTLCDHPPSGACGAPPPVEPPPDAGAPPGSDAGEPPGPSGDAGPGGGSDAGDVAPPPPPGEDAGPGAGLTPGETRTLTGTCSAVVPRGGSGGLVAWLVLAGLLARRRARRARGG